MGGERERTRPTTHKLFDPVVAVVGSLRDDLQSLCGRRKTIVSYTSTSCGFGV